MVNLKDSIRYKNVISKRFTTNFSDVEKCFETFSQELKEKDIMVKGPFYVAINDLSEEGPLDVELFASIYPLQNVPDGMNFHTYYSVEHMASMVVKNNIDKNVTKYLRSLLVAINSIGCKTNSSIYLVYENLFGQTYVTIKIAYVRDKENSNQEKAE